jgi:DNA polymerase-1
MKKVYRVISKFNEIPKLIEDCISTGYCCYDFETSGKYYSPDSYPTSIAIAYQPGFVHVIPLAHPASPFKEVYLKILNQIGHKLIENEEVVKIAHNAKYEMQWFLRYGFIHRGRVFCTMLAKYLLDEVRPHDLKSITAKFYPDSLGYDDEVNILAKKYGWGNIPLKKLTKYNALDVYYTFKLAIRFEDKLIKAGLYSLYRNLYMQCTHVIAESEFVGIKVDTSYLERISAEYADKLVEIETSITRNKILRRYIRKYREQQFSDLIAKARVEIEYLRRRGQERQALNREKKISLWLAGKATTQKEAKILQDFNLRSVPQLVNLLYESKYGFKFPIIDYTWDNKLNKPSNKPSTSEATLLKLQSKDKHGFIEKLLKHREISKLHSTYMEGLKPLVQEDGYIHGNFNIAGTVTGRYSSTEPNLQNIPRSITAYDIKKMFVPPEGMLLVEVDYSQAELRVVAEIANDKAMIDIFKRNYNIHVATACKMNGGIQLYDEVKAILKDENHPKHEYWEKAKKRGKILNFSILYQQGAEATAEALGCSVEEGKEFQRKWFKQFPGVAKWIEKQKRIAYQQGFVKTLFGSKRRLPDIYSVNRGTRAEAERQSINSPIQGTCALFTNFATVEIRKAKLRGELPWYLHQPYTVHDSIGFYVKPEDVHWVVAFILNVAQNLPTDKYFGFKMKKVSMKVSAEVGKTWADLKDYNPEENYASWLSEATPEK